MNVQKKKGLPTNIASKLQTSTGARQCSIQGVIKTSQLQILLTRLKGLCVGTTQEKIAFEEYVFSCENPSKCPTLRVRRRIQPQSVWTLRLLSEPDWQKKIPVTIRTIHESVVDNGIIYFIMAMGYHPDFRYVREGYHFFQPSTNIHVSVTTLKIINSDGSHKLLDSQSYFVEASTQGAPTKLNENANCLLEFAKQLQPIVLLEEHSHRSTNTQPPIVDEKEHLERMAAQAAVKRQQEHLAMQQRAVNAASSSTSTNYVQQVGGINPQMYRQNPVSFQPTYPPQGFSTQAQSSYAGLALNPHQQ